MSGPKHRAGDPNGAADFAMSEEDYSRVRALIMSMAGIRLGEAKQNMVYNRLVRRLRATGAPDFATYLDSILVSRGGEREAFVNALTTNLTAFFREPHHFDMLASRAAATARPLRVWSSACSTGEEVWSAAMVLRESGRGGELLATDIDTQVLATAKAGIYALERVASLRPQRLRRHFLQGVDQNAGRVKVRPELAAMVRFERRNLQADDWLDDERFDVIFCRNVAIYFDGPAQRALLERFARVLRPGGLLMVGHSEMFPASSPSFRAFGNTTYERVNDRAPGADVR